MAGYPVPYGYMGLIGECWMLFATESEYYEHWEDNENDQI